jgi:hypothetical protein
LFCPVSEVAPSRAENNMQLGNTFFITSMYLDFISMIASKATMIYAMARITGNDLTSVK